LSGVRDSIADREPSTSSLGERIAFKIVTGFLGAGKTILIRAIARLEKNANSQSCLMKAVQLVSSR
jgi:predicted ATPase